MTRLCLHFWSLAATFRIRSSGKKNMYLKYVSSHFLILAIELHLVCFGSGASFMFELHCSFVITAYTFSVVIISLHIWKYAILLCLAWLTNKRLGFTLWLNSKRHIVMTLFPQRLNSSSSVWLGVLSTSLRLSPLSAQSTLLWTVHRQHRITVVQQ